MLVASLVALEEPHRATYREETTIGPFSIGRAEDRLTLEERSAGTTVRFETYARLNGVFGLAGLLPLTFYERQLGRVAEGLRNRLAG